MEHIKDLRDSVRAFRALGQETRFRIVSLLLSKTFSVGELEKHLKVSQSAISQQLRVLEKAGLVKLQKEGKYTFCSINRSFLEEINRRINLLLEGRQELGLTE
ncbi:MAG TPA: winged helix-turn-helix transcriptional regulator [Firmicutes bacterium]|nr:winged helix-turn-helix transcriptional regulator [Bacillota bacterium]